MRSLPFWSLILPIVVACFSILSAQNTSNDDRYLESLNQFTGDPAQIRRVVAQRIRLSNVSAEQSSTFLANTIQISLKSLNTFSDVLSFDQAVIENGLPLIYQSFGNPDSINQFYSQLSQGNLIWARNNNVAPSRLFQDLSYLSTNYIQRSRTQTSFNFTVENVLQRSVDGLYSGVNYLSNRLNLNKQSIMGSMLGGIVHSCMENDNKNLRNLVIEDFVTTAYQAESIQHNQEISRILAQGAIKGALASLHYSQSPILNSEIEEISQQVSAAIIKNRTSSSQTNNLSYGVISQFSEKPIILDKTTGKAIPPGLIRPGMTILENYSINASENEQIAITLPDNRRLEFVNGASFEIRKLSTENNGEVIPQIFMNKGTLHIQGNQRGGTLILENRAGSYRFSGSNAKIAITNGSNGLNINTQVASGTLTYTNQLNNSFRVVAGSEFLLNQNNLLQNPIINAISTNNLNQLNTILPTVVESISPRIKNQARAITKEAASFRFNQSISNHLLALSEGITQGLVEEATSLSISTVELKSLIQSVSKGATTSTITLARELKLDINTSIKQVSKGLSQGAIKAVERSGYARIKIDPNNSESNSTEPFVIIPNGQNISTTGNSLSFNQSITDSLFGNFQKKNLSDAMTSKAESTFAKIQASNALNINRSTLISSQQSTLISTHLKNGNLVLLNNAIENLVSDAFSSNSDKQEKFALISEITQLVTNPENTNPAQVDSVISQTIESFNQALLKQPKDNRIESIARLSNAIAKGVTKNAARQNITTPQMVRRIAESVSSTWLSSTNISIDEKIQVVKGINYGLPYQVANSLLSNPQSSELSDKIKKIAEETSSGIITSALNDAANLELIINASTDAFTSSLITVASKKNLSSKIVPQLTADSAYGILNGSITALDNSILSQEPNITQDQRSDVISALSSKVSESIASSGIEALKMNGYADVIPEVTSSNANGTASGTLLAAKKQELNVKNIAFAISRGTALGSSKILPNRSAESIVETIGIGQGSSINSVREISNFSNREIETINQALKEGRESILDNSNYRSVILNYVSSSRKIAIEENISINSVENLLFPGQAISVSPSKGNANSSNPSITSLVSSFLRSNDPEVIATSNPIIKSISPQELVGIFQEDDFQDTKAVLSSIPDYQPVIDEDRNNLPDNSASDSSDQRLISQLLLPSIAQGAIDSVFSPEISPTLNDPNNNAKLNETVQASQLLESITEGMTEGNFTGFNEVKQELFNENIEGIKQTGTNVIIANIISSITDISIKKNINIQQVINAVVQGAVRGSLNGADTTNSDLGDTTVNVSKSIDKGITLANDKITNAPEDSYQSPIDIDSINLSKSLTAKETINKISTKNALEDGKSIIEASLEALKSENFIGDTLNKTNEQNQKDLMVNNTTGNSNESTFQAQPVEEIFKQIEQKQAQIVWQQSTGDSALNASSRVVGRLRSELQNLSQNTVSKVDIIIAIERIAIELGLNYQLVLGNIDNLSANELEANIAAYSTILANSSTNPNADANSIANRLNAQISNQKSLTSGRILTIAQQLAAELNISTSQVMQEFQNLAIRSGKTTAEVISDASGAEQQAGIVALETFSRDTGIPLASFSAAIESASIANNTNIEATFEGFESAVLGSGGNLESFAAKINSLSAVTDAKFETLFSGSISSVLKTGSTSTAIATADAILNTYNSPIFEQISIQAGVPVSAIVEGIFSGVSNSSNSIEVAVNKVEIAYREILSFSTSENLALVRGIALRSNVTEAEIFTQVSTLIASGGSALRAVQSLTIIAANQGNISQSTITNILISDLFTSSITPAIPTSGGNGSSGTTSTIN